MLCGRYEGFDERIRQHLVTRVISIGDYVLTGGELPALILIDALARLQAGVLGDKEATDDDSHAQDGLLEYPQWTKPPVFRGWTVPEVMQNGNLPEQLKWKRQQSLIRTLKWRPDLLEKANLTEKDKKFLKAYNEEETESR